MEKETINQGSIPFAYEILDEEAAKISSLILAVQQKCALANGIEVARELFDWAESFTSQGRRNEAEFVYLHAITLCERHQALTYPVVFTSLRDFARMLLNKSNEPAHSAQVTQFEPRSSKPLKNNAA